jgi:thiol:disulfide interchange protein DsbD
MRLQFGSPIVRWLAFAFLPVLLSGCQTEQEHEDLSPHSDAELISEVSSARPGEPFSVGLSLTLDPGWHSYWLNPGDAGQPASIEWDLPAGYRVSEIQWPLPRKVEESTVVSYGYDNEVMLLTEITPPRSVTIGQSVSISARAHWLVCENICLPAEADLEFEIRISDEASQPNSQWREAFAETRRRLPVVASGWTMSATRDQNGFVLEVEPDGPIPQSIEGAFFFVNERGVLDHGASQTVSRGDGRFSISLTRSKYARSEPERLEGVLAMPQEIALGSVSTRAVYVDVSVVGEQRDMRKTPQ